MTIGEKRNKMISIARGDYVAFVDDDDAVAPDYVTSILTAIINEKPDVVCFTVLVTGHGPPKPCRYHPQIQHANLPNEYRRQPNHLMAWRRAIASQVSFPAVKSGEDTAWAQQAAPLAAVVATIDKTLYTYQYDPRDNSDIR